MNCPETVSTATESNASALMVSLDTNVCHHNRFQQP